ncbi:MAG: YlxR family protein [Fimbriimonadales bacterium]
MERGAPQRTCIGCRCKKEQNLLLRISRRQSGDLTFSLEINRSGRGAYICRRPECIEAALKGDRLGRALRSPVSADEKVTLRKELVSECRTDQQPNDLTT